MINLRSTLFLFALMGSLVWTSQVSALVPSQLTVVVNGLRNTQGQVCVTIFANSKGFPHNHDGVLKSKCNQIYDRSSTITFDNLQAGTYAVAVIHDQNQDQILNLNYLGIPTEGFGFSRNPKVRTSAPKFQDAAFFLAGPNTVIQVTMKYF
jgi:uncharacterized protein (DUF2141 family)